MERLYDWFNERGTLYLKDGRRIGPGETFSAPSSSVPLGFMDTVRRLGGGEVVPIPSLAGQNIVEVELEPEPGPAYLPETLTDTHYIVEERQGGGWFDVVIEGTGTAVNSQALRRTAAEALAEEMNNGDSTG